jgi:hypothetical protein
MPMSPRLLRPRASGATHPEALGWATRAATNGGTVSSSTLAAVSTFCASIDAASGLRAAILRLNLFCGHSDASLNAVRTPLYLSESFGGATIGNATDANFNFVAGDYAETGGSGGLKGDGTSKYLNTGFNYSSLASASNTHLSFSGTSLETGAGDRMAVASFEFPGETNRLCILDIQTGAANRGWRSSLSGQALYTNTGITAEPHMIGTRTASNVSRVYRSGTQAVEATVSATAITFARPFFVFAGNNSGTAGAFTAGRFRMYSIGNGLTAAQALAFSNAVIAFNTALGRA